MRAMKDAGESKHSQNNCGIVSVVLGILSLVFVFLPIFGSILALTGLIFAIMQDRYSRNSWSTAGFWLNGTGLILGIIWSVIYIKYVIGVMKLIQEGSLAQGNLGNGALQ